MLNQEYYQWIYNQSANAAIEIAITMRYTAGFVCTVASPGGDLDEAWPRVLVVFHSDAIKQCLDAEKRFIARTDGVRVSFRWGYN